MHTPQEDNRDERDIYMEVAQSSLAFAEEQVEKETAKIESLKADRSCFPDVLEENAETNAAWTAANVVKGIEASIAWSEKAVADFEKIADKNRRAIELLTRPFLVDRAMMKLLSRIMLAMSQENPSR